MFVEMIEWDLKQDVVTVAFHISTTKMPMKKSHQNVNRNQKKSDNKNF